MPSSSTNFVISFVFLLWLVDLWKYLEFLSPSFSHICFALCYYLIFSSSSNLSISLWRALIATVFEPLLEFCKLDSWCSLVWVSLRCFRRECLLHWTREALHLPRFLLNEFKKRAYWEDWVDQLDWMRLQHSSFKFQLASNLKSFSLPISSWDKLLLPLLKDITIGLWSEVWAASARMLQLSNNLVHSRLPKTWLSVSLVNWSPSLLLH